MSRCSPLGVLGLEWRNLGNAGQTEVTKVVSWKVIAGFRVDLLLPYLVSGGRPCDRLAQLPRLITKTMDEVRGVGQFGRRLIDSEP